MTRYVIPGEGFKEYDRLVERLAQIDSRSSEWYTVINEITVLDMYIHGETRRITEASFKPGLVSAFERLLKKGFIISEEV